MGVDTFFIEYDNSDSFPTEPASAACEFAEDGNGPPVCWTSLLSQHRGERLRQMLNAAEETLAKQVKPHMHGTMLYTVISAIV